MLRVYIDGKHTRLNILAPDTFSLAVSGGLQSGGLQRASGETSGQWANGRGVVRGRETRWMTHPLQNPQHQGDLLGVEESVGHQGQAGLGVSLQLVVAVVVLHRGDLEHGERGVVLKTARILKMIPVLPTQDVCRPVCCRRCRHYTSDRSKYRDSRHRMLKNTLLSKLV